MNPGGSVESLCLLHLWGWMTQCHFLLPLLHLQPLFVSKIWQKPATVRLLVRGLGPGGNNGRRLYLQHGHPPPCCLIMPRLRIHSKSAVWSLSHNFFREGATCCIATASYALAFRTPVSPLGLYSPSPQGRRVHNSREPQIIRLVNTLNRCLGRSFL